MASAHLMLLDSSESAFRLSRLCNAVSNEGADIAVIRSNAMKLYLTGRVFDGYIFINAKSRKRKYFVRRPIHLTGDEVHLIRKPEDIPALLAADEWLGDAKSIGFDFTTFSVGDFNRLTALFKGLSPLDISRAVRIARSVKSEVEISKIAESGRLQTDVYREIPGLFRRGMTDVDFQIEIERALRRHGCLGQFRISGDSMELFMGSILAGDNADSPSPYDFAMGGAGLDPSLPVGANGTMIADGMTVMVDANGNFTGYMTDMTRTFALGKIDSKAFLAHQVSIEICQRLSQAAIPGAKASDLYQMAWEIAQQAGLSAHFMGHRQQAGFVGHGVGIEINEAPVIAPKSRDILEAGNVIALEPKFVIPGTWAVGIENTYVVTSNGPARCMTLAPESIVPL